MRLAPAGCRLSGRERTRSERLQALRHFLAHEAVGSQELLVEKLTVAGYQVTQSSVSRDLADLGVSKRNGRYLLPSLAAAFTGVRSAALAGPNQLVLKTDVGAANLIAGRIDELQLPEIVGTIAGDDTIFIATKGADDQAGVVTRLGVALHD